MTEIKNCTLKNEQIIEKIKNRINKNELIINVIDSCMMALQEKVGYSKHDAEELIKDMFQEIISEVRWGLNEKNKIRLGMCA